MELCLFIQITAELIPIDEKLDESEAFPVHGFPPSDNSNYVMEKRLAYRVRRKVPADGKSCENGRRTS